MSRPDRVGVARLRVRIQPLGDVALSVFNPLKSGLERALPVTCRVAEGVIQLPDWAYNGLRGQHLSSALLEVLADTAGEGEAVLGIASVDLYTPGLNFVFGEARCPGSAAVVSTHRLSPEYYGGEADQRLFLERLVKEAVHELGHALGLRHCPNPRCVMSFSNSIRDTDRKGMELCPVCHEAAGEGFQGVQAGGI